jgi:membrane protease YdiL (CAAX protease family)
VSKQRAVVRAVAFASAIALVVWTARSALLVLPLSRAASLATDALASSLVLALAAFGIASLAGTAPAARLGLRAGVLRARDVAIGVLGVVALSHAAETALRWLDVVSPALVRFDDALAGMDLAGAIYPFAVLTFASACGEELFFRGLLQRGLVRRIGAPGGVALAALAFGAAHGDWLHGAAAFLLGLFLGALAQRADSIRPAIAAHAANNGLALLEKLGGVEPPAGPVATPLALLVALTLCCVSAIALARATPAASLQRPAGPADNGRQPGC